MNPIILVLLAVAAIGIGVYLTTANARKRENEKVYGPIQLHAKHGGKICSEPDWPALRQAFYEALVEVGGEAGAAEYKNYAFDVGSNGKSADSNTRTHYRLHGNNYPEHIHPCHH